MLATIHPWWPHLLDWPRVFDPISWWWRSADGYALTSSWFQPMWIVTLMVVLRHHNCHVHGCLRLRTYPYGHYRLCKKHHPEVPNDGRVTQKHIDAMGGRHAV